MCRFVTYFWGEWPQSPPQCKTYRTFCNYDLFPLGVICIWKKCTQNKKGSAIKLDGKPSALSKSPRSMVQKAPSPLTCTSTPCFPKSNPGLVSCTAINHRSPALQRLCHPILDEGDAIYRIATSTPFSSHHCHHSIPADWFAGISLFIKPSFTQPISALYSVSITAAVTYAPVITLSDSSQEAASLFRLQLLATGTICNTI